MEPQGSTTLPLETVESLLVHYMAYRDIRALPGSTTLPLVTVGATRIHYLTTIPLVTEGSYHDPLPYLVTVGSHLCPQSYL